MEKKDRNEEKEMTEAIRELNRSDTRNAVLKTKIKRFLVELVQVVAISLAIILPVRYFLIQPFYVKGASMEPNFHDYEYLIVDEISYRFREPHRGDVVVLRDPRDRSQFFIKRIIGLPRERIVITDGQLIILNDQNLKEGFELVEDRYLDPGILTQGQEDLVLGDNEYYILGDNRHASLDSRIFGSIQRKEIVGRIWIRAWPFHRIKHFKTLTYPSPSDAQAVFQ